MAMRAYDIEHLRCCSPSQAFWVDLLVVDFGGSRLASCDTPDGPTLVWDVSRIGPVLGALEPFDDVLSGVSGNPTTGQCSGLWQPHWVESRAQVPGGRFPMGDALSRMASATRLLVTSPA